MVRQKLKLGGDQVKKIANTLQEVKNFVHNWGGVVSIVKVHHGGTYSNQTGLMYYTSFFNTILSLTVIFFLLIFSSNDFA